MVSQHEIDFMSMKIDALEKEAITFNKRDKARGKALNELWEKGKELRKEIVELKKYCGKLTFDLSKLYLENRIIVTSANEKIGCEPKQFLVRDIVRQLINESGYNLEFKVLQMRYPTTPDLTMTGKEIKNK